MKALFIPADGHCLVVSGDWNSLPALYGQLDCTTVERVLVTPSPDGPRLLMWVDEEGKYGPRPLNQLATELVSDRLDPQDWIAGPALITGESDLGECDALSTLEILRLGARLVRGERARS